MRPAGYRERVTRIIAGAAGGLRLDVPDAGTRPTSDRVRESLFSALEASDALDGAHVLDLYAGSGALGLEALSRGAQRVDLVEKSRAAAGLIRRNAERVRAAIGERTVVVHEGVVRAFLARASGPYDLVFSDPPYELDDAQVNADLVAVAPLLAPHALVIVERGRRAAAPDFAAAGLAPLRHRVYGDTVLWWAVMPNEAEQHPPPEAKQRR